MANETISYACPKCGKGMIFWGKLPGPICEDCDKAAIDAERANAAKSPGYWSHDGRHVNGKTPSRIVKIGRKGIVAFEFETGGPFEVDVVNAMTQWWTIDETFREVDAKTGERNIPAVRLEDWNAALWKFFQEAVTAHGCTYKLCLAEAKEFRARLQEEYERIADFFVAKPPEKSISPNEPAPASSVELRFST